MTIDEVRKSDKQFLTPAEIAPILGCDPQTIRDSAGRNPMSLGFPVARVGTRTKIPRKSFLAFMEGGSHDY